MKSKVSLLGITICIVFGFSSSAIGDTHTPTFKIGDLAPQIYPVTWLQGKAVTEYEPGRVYVVEFWATWCPPCVKAIPHLSSLQRRYASALTIIGVNAEGLLGFTANLDTVRDFMNKHGKEMAYPVALEDPVKKAISERWVTATGSMGAPTAGIIDQQGKLVWIGYPDRLKGYTFDHALADTLAGKVDLAQSRALQVTASEDTAKYLADKAQP